MPVLDDRIAIDELLVRCVSAVDRRDWPLLRSVFTADAEFDYAFLGSWTSADEFTDVMEERHGRVGTALHRLTNVDIEFGDAGSATAHSYLDALILNVDGEGGRHVVGGYDDEVVSDRGGWRIRRRGFSAVSVHAIAKA